MTATIIRGDALHLPLADESVDLICTSPPYFGLRSYTDGGQHYAGQLGSEPTPAEYVDALIVATREMIRVLKPSGSIWVNLGDKYAQDTERSRHGEGNRQTTQDGGLTRGSYLGATIELGQRQNGVPRKSLIGIPWRYAIRCIDQLGLILRRDQIWAKPNGLPESAEDRCATAHEYWFHFVRQPRYYSAVDEIREQHSVGPATGPAQRLSKDASPYRGAQTMGTNGHNLGLNPLGKLPRSWWVIPTEPLNAPKWRGEEPGHPHTYFFGKDHDQALIDAEKWRQRFPGRTLIRMADHFAAYPTEWPRRIIQGWTPSAICVTCGQGRRPMRDLDWSQIPHTLEWRRNREPTDGERSETGELFRQWRASRGVSRRDFVPHLPTYKNADSVTAQVSNWELGKNVPMPDDLDRLENWLGPAPDRLRQIVGQMAMMPVAQFAIGIGGEGTGRHRNREPSERPSGYVSITGYTCACPTPDAPTRPAVVLDPFGGTGTTSLVADVLGRHAIHVDLSMDYNRLAQWRTTDPDQRAKAARMEKPPPVIDGQLDLLGGLL